MSLVKLEAELAEVSNIRERLYWEFTRSKTASPVPADVTRKFYDLTEKIRVAKLRPNAQHDQSTVNETQPKH